MTSLAKPVLLPGLDLRDSVGKAANLAAAAGVFFDYRMTLAVNTLRRHRAALELFAEYLGEKGLRPNHLHDDPAAWHGITWGLVDGFYKWLLLQGYSVGSANVNLSTIKTYARLAIKAGVLDPTESQLIETVRSRSRRRDRQRIDEQRLKEGIPTRIGAKKAEPLLLTSVQVAMLKQQPDTPQGRRDYLLLCLLLDHGLRIGEVAGLHATDIDLQTGIFSVYRPKVDKRQIHRLSADTLAAATRYFSIDYSAIRNPSPALLAGSAKSGALKGSLSIRAIFNRVRLLGKQIGVMDLSPHDCRHTWATLASRAHTPLERLMDAGGWSSYAMPLRYIQSNEIANEGIILNSSD
ncbi:MAG: tyrosine-type recombinase/integrase [Leptolinea sp.]